MKPYHPPVSHTQVRSILLLIGLLIVGFFVMPHLIEALGSRENPVEIVDETLF